MHVSAALGCFPGERKAQVRLKGMPGGICRKVDHFVKGGAGGAGRRHNPGAWAMYVVGGGAAQRCADDLACPGVLSVDRTISGPQILT